MQPTRTHTLKTDHDAFQAVIRGDKTYEIRRDDRGFEVGDRLNLLETVSTGAEMAAGAVLEYTSGQHYAIVTHILRGPIYGLAEGWVILSIKDEPCDFNPGDAEPAHRAIEPLRDDAATVGDFLVVQQMLISMANSHTVASTYKDIARRAAKWMDRLRDDRDEWYRQHENLLAVKNADNKALAKRIADLKTAAPPASALQGRQRLAEELGTSLPASADAPLNIDDAEFGMDEHVDTAGNSLAPKAAPAPDVDALQRWGNADTDEVGRKSGWHQRDDGYWTPWHLANAALVSLQEQIARQQYVIEWALGEHDTFPDWPATVTITGNPKYWWRKELRKRYDAAMGRKTEGAQD